VALVVARTPPGTSPLFPYTTLFRSHPRVGAPCQARTRSPSRSGGARRCVRRGSSAEAKLSTHEDRAPSRREVLHLLVRVIEQILDAPRNREAGRAIPRQEHIELSGAVDAHVRRER